MGNMSYCRFENTSCDLEVCFYAIDDEDLSEDEAQARKRLIALCVDIACDYGYEVDKPCIAPNGEVKSER